MQGIGYNVFENHLFQSVFFVKPLLDGVSVSFPDAKVAYAMLGNPNHVGTFVALVYPVILTYTITLKAVIEKYFFVLIQVLLIVFYLLSKSTGGMIGIVGGVVVVLGVVYIKKIDQLGAIIRMFTFVVLVSVVIVGMIPNTGVNVERFNVLRNEYNNFYLNDVIFKENQLIYQFNNDLIWKAENKGGSIIYSDRFGDSLEWKLIDGQVQFIDSTYKMFKHEVLREGEKGTIRFTEFNYAIQFNDNRFWYEKAFMIFDQINTVPKVNVEGYERLGSGRAYIWSRTLPMLKETILYGKGTDTFVVHFPQHDLIGKTNMGNARIVVDKPHNYYMLIGVTSGVVSLVSVLVLLLNSLVVQIKSAGR